MPVLMPRGPIHRLFFAEDGDRARLPPSFHIVPFDIEPPLRVFGEQHGGFDDLAFGAVHVLEGDVLCAVDLHEIDVACRPRKRSAALDTVLGQRTPRLLCKRR